MTSNRKSVFHSEACLANYKIKASFLTQCIRPSNWSLSFIIVSCCIYSRIFVVISFVYMCISCLIWPSNWLLSIIIFSCCILFENICFQYIYLSVYFLFNFIIKSHDCQSLPALLYNPICDTRLSFVLCLSCDRQAEENNPGFWNCVEWKLLVL